MCVCVSCGCVARAYVSFEDLKFQNDELAPVPVGSNEFGSVY